LAGRKCNCGQGQGPCLKSNLLLTVGVLELVAAKTRNCSKLEQLRNEGV